MWILLTCNLDASCSLRTSDFDRRCRASRISCGRSRRTATHRQAGLHCAEDCPLPLARPATRTGPLQMPLHGPASYARERLASIQPAADSERCVGFRARACANEVRFSHVCSQRKSRTSRSMGGGIDNEAMVSYIYVKTVLYQYNRVVGSKPQKGATSLPHPGSSRHSGRPRCALPSPRSRVGTDSRPTDSS